MPPIQSSSPVVPKPDYLARIILWQWSSPFCLIWRTSFAVFTYIYCMIPISLIFFNAWETGETEKLDTKYFCYKLSKRHILSVTCSSIRPIRRVMSNTVCPILLAGSAVVIISPLSKAFEPPCITQSYYHILSLKWTILTNLFKDYPRRWFHILIGILEKSF